MAWKAGAAFGALRGAIELCGRHPFATGSLALVGLAFSIFSFFDDAMRVQAEEKTALRIEKRLSDIGDQVSAIPEPVADPENFTPITVRGGKHNADNIFAPPSEMDRIKLIDYEAYSNLEGGFADPSLALQQSFHEQFVWSVTLTSVAEKEFVQIAPYILVDILKVERIQQPLSGLYFGERGAAVENRNFLYSAAPVIGVQFARFVEFDRDFNWTESKTDFFSLEPGEIEEFVLHIDHRAGYIYTARYGIQYRYKGKDRILWLSDTIRMGQPDFALPITGFSGVPETKWFQDREIAAGWDEAGFMANQAKAFSGRTFNPSQVGLSRLQAMPE